MIDDVTLAFSPGSLRALNGALALIMVGVALDLKLSDLRGLLADPRAPIVGLIAQGLLLPPLAFAIAWAIGAAPSVALGLILVGACPGGNMSNVLTQLAGGRVAVSVGMTAVSTLGAMFTTPAHLWLWGGLRPETAALVREVAVDPLEVVGTVGLVLALPCAVGMAIAERAPALAARLRGPMQRLSMLFFAAVVAAALWSNRAAIGAVLPSVFGPVALLHGAAVGLGYGAATLTGLPEPDRRAVTLEVSIQNTALGLALVFTFFDGLGGMAAVAAWWGLWHLLAGGALAAWWRRAA